MTLQIALPLCIIAVALALFAWERFSAEVVALGVLLSLVFTRPIADKSGVRRFW
jgi:hypothetical protein